MLYNIALALAALHAVSAEPLQNEKRQSNCTNLELIIARGTTEPNAAGGRFGVIVGDPLFEDTQLLIPDIAGYPVNYPASAASNSLSLGISDTLSHLTSAIAACPDQVFALAGYSQGAAVVNTALSQLDPSLYDKIIAVVQFGDPANKGQGSLPAALVQKRKENCALGDPVCTNNGSDFTKHLSYNNQGTTFMNDSAAYIQKQLESGGKAGPDNVDDSPAGNQTADNTAGLAALGSYLRPGLSSSNSSSNSSSASNSTSPVGNSTVPVPVGSSNTTSPVAGGSSATNATTSTNETASSATASGAGGSSTTGAISTPGPSPASNSPTSSPLGSYTGSANAGHLTMGCFTASILAVLLSFL